MKQKTPPEKEPREKAVLTPDRRVLTERSAMRLSEISGIGAKELVGMSIADIGEKLRWRIDPEILLFRRICGRVVKKDPVTGEEHPVPFATVHVEDTDCSFLGLFPVESPWMWLFPVSCRRELITTVQTDACGKFCVWIPRFEIDWILRWRRVRRCYGHLFWKPTIRDILDQIREMEHDHPIIKRPPLPDPPPDLLEPGLGKLRVASEMLGTDIARKLAGDLQRATFGEKGKSHDSILDKPAFPTSVPPPRPTALRDIQEKEGGGGIARLMNFSDKQAKELDRLSLRRYIGPFFRCRDIYIPELTPIVDVPDITFRVTQDTNNDGVEETIYSENFFDVRWNSGSIPDVTLYADPNAIVSLLCNPPDLPIPCKEPGIYLVGNMPLINPPSPPGFPYVNTTTGYAVRPSRPHASGRADEVPAAGVAASSPLAGVLTFWGCHHHTPKGAPVQFYKVLVESSSDGGGSWSPPVPIFDSWSLFRVVGSPPILQHRTISADGAGWYPVVNAGEGWLPGEHLILRWHSAPNGMHRLTLQLGDAALNVVHTAPPVPIQVDHSAPHVEFTKLEWRPVGGGAWTNVGLVCPTIHRGGQSIELRVSFNAWATHLQSIGLGASGCGGGNPSLQVGFEAFQTGVPAGIHTSTYWHKSGSDNNLSNAPAPAIFRLDPGSHPPGAYSIGVTAFSRAFNPSDGHEFLPNSTDVGYNPAPIWTPATLPIAVVD